MNHSISPQRWAELKALLERVTALPADQQDEKAEQLCGDDPVLLRALLELLRHHREAVECGFLDLQHGRSSLGDETLNEPSTAAWTATGAATGDDDRRDVERPREAQPLPTIGERFEIMRELGQGGMGRVLMAHDRILERVVAIKQPRHMEDEQGRRRFLEEARAVAQLHHPNVCTIHEIVPDNDPPCIVMEFIDGVALHEWSLIHKPNPQQSARLMALVAQAVDFAHQHGVIHRDIKPQNILIRRESDEPVLMDFGLAKRDSPQRPEMTDAGLVMGTPAYMSPEQAAGAAQRIGPQSDVYCLGAVLYHLVTGQPPFSGAPGEILHKVQATSPVPPRKAAPRIHRDLETIILKAMAREPHDRYGSAAELAGDLSRFAAGESILARPEGALKKSLRHMRRHPVATVAAVLLVLAAAFALDFGIRIHKVAMLRESIESAVDANHWSRQAVVQVESSLQALSAIDHQQADRYRSRIYRDFAATVEALVRRPELTAQDIKQIHHDLAFLSERNPSLSGPLERMLENRRRQWQPLLELAAPFSNLTDALLSPNVRIDDNHLMAGDRYVVTRCVCEGNVSLYANFSEGWPAASSVGLVLGATVPSQNGTSTNEGYQFRLLPFRPSEAPPLKNEPTFADGIDAYGKITAQILRNGSLLREAAVDVSNGPLELTATRRANELVLQINEQHVDFYDTFSIPGGAERRFAVEWSSPLRLARLRASRLNVAQAASPLARGDFLYGRGRYADALAEFENQAISVADTQYADQSRLKQALCLRQLNRLAEAAERLEPLALVRDDHIRKAALGQLWEIRLAQNRHDDAFAVFESLSTQYAADNLTPYVPTPVIAGIIRHYHLLGLGINQFAFKPQLQRELEKSVAVETFFNIRGRSHDLSRFYLTQAYFLRDQFDQALLTTETLLREHPTWEHAARDWWFLLFEQYCWLLRLRDQSPRALDELDQRLWTPSGKVRAMHGPLLVERARLNANMNDLAAARHDLARFFELAEDHRASYYFHASARLLEGFLLLQSGDGKAAERSWRKGLPSDELDYFWLKNRDKINFGYSLLLASLTNAFSEKDVRWIINRAMPKLQAINYSGLYTAIRHFLPEFTPDVVARLVNDFSETERGHRAARQIAFRNGPPMQLLNDAVAATAVTSADQLLFDRKISQSQRDLVAELAVDGYQAVFAGEISRTQLVQLAFAWQGITNFVGWGGVAPTLRPDLRGRIAYCLGVRYAQLGRFKDARPLFETAIDDSDADPLLCHLAESAIEQIRNRQQP